MKLYKKNFESCDEPIQGTEIERDCDEIIETSLINTLEESIKNESVSSLIDRNQLYGNKEDVDIFLNMFTQHEEGNCYNSLFAQIINSEEFNNAHKDSESLSSLTTKLQPLLEKLQEAANLLVCFYRDRFKFRKRKANQIGKAWKHSADIKVIF